MACVSEKRSLMIIYGVFAIIAIFWIIILAKNIPKYPVSTLRQETVHVLQSQSENSRHTYVDHEDQILGKIKNLPPFIIVMTQWRFGSSVIGELFNQNSDLLYIFESLWPAFKLREEKGILQYTPESQTLSRKILRGFAKCEFDASYVKIMRDWSGLDHNKVLCHNNTSCRMDSNVALGDFCRTFQGRLATKLIHADLDMLKPLVVEDEINLKILHLVRDPRGAVASRLNYLMTMNEGGLKQAKSRIPNAGRLAAFGLLDFTPEDMLGIQEMRVNNPTAQGMCQWIRENLNMESDHLSPWLRGRYHLVKYEDFAKAPLAEAQKIYDFIGMPLKEQVKQWLQENTHSSRNVSAKQLLFSHRKNAQKTARQWLNNLSVFEARQIAGECMDVLKLLGYELY